MIFALIFIWFFIGYIIQRVDGFIEGKEKLLFMAVWPVYLSLWYTGLISFKIKKRIKAWRKRREDKIIES